MPCVFAEIKEGYINLSQMVVNYSQVHKIVPIAFF